MPANSRDSPLDALLGYHLRRASTVMMAALAGELAQFDLTVVEASVLVAIDAAPGITQSEAGRRLDIHRANMAPIAAKLEQLGLATRTTAGRSTQLRPSARGAKTARAVRSAMRHNDERFFGQLEEQQRRELAALLRDMWQRERGD